MPFSSVTTRARNQTRRAPRIATSLSLIAGLAISFVAISPADAVVSPAGTQTTTLEANFTTLNQSLWGPGNAAAPANQTMTLFDESWNESAGGEEKIDLEVDLGALGSIDFGTLGGSGSISTNGSIGMSLDLEGLDGGKVAVDYPVKVDVTTPEPKTFGAGDTIEISTSPAVVQPGAKITTVEPTADAVALNGKFQLNAAYGFEVCIFECFGSNGNLIDVPLTSSEIYSVSAAEIQSNSPGSPAGTHCFGSLEKSLFGTRSAADPTRCTDNAGYVAQPRPVVTTTTNSDGSLSASGTDKFAVIPISGMTWLQRLSGESLPLNKRIGLGAGAHLEWETFDVGLNTQVSRTEELEFTPEVDVTLAFPRALNHRVVTPDGTFVSTGNGSSVTLRAGNKVLVDLPTDQTAPFSITPTLSLAKHDLSNKVTHTIAFAGEMSVMSASAQFPDVDIEIYSFDGLSFSIGPVYEESFSAPSTTIVAVPQSTWALGGFNSPTFAPIAIVPAPPPVVTPVTVTPIEGAPTDLTVATFTDEVTKAVPADYVATITWGDGTATSPGIITGSNGSYAITARHTYEQYGTYSVSIDLRTVPAGQLATNHVVTASSAIVSDAALAGTGLTNNTTASGQDVLIWSNPSPAAPNNAVARFTDANPFGLLSDLNATIDWGDGTPITTGVVSGPQGGPFTVSGHHDYVRLGLNTVTVVLTSKGGSQATTTTTTLSYTNPTAGTFVLGQGKATGAVTYWGSQWANLNGFSGSTSSFKGFASQTAPTCGATWKGTSATGASDTPPSTVPTYMAVTVTDRVTTKGTTATGVTKAVVIVETRPGYGPGIAQTGTGTVVAVLCGNVG